MSDNYKGYAISNSRLGTASFYGHRDLYAAQDEFLTKGTPIGATLYFPPTSRYKAQIERSEFITIDVAKTRSYQKNLVAGSIGPYGEDVSFHFKSLTRRQGGNVEAFLSTANVSKGNTDDSWFNRLVVSAAAIVPAIKSLQVPVYEKDVGIKFTSLPIDQENTGIKLTGQLAENFLAVQREIASGNAIASADLGDGYQLTRGDRTANIITNALTKVGRGDIIDVTSPYLANESIINGLIRAKSLGANVTITMSPAYTTDASRETTKRRLASAGINVYTSREGNLIHSKNIVIKGRNVKLAMTGSDNMTNASGSNKTLDYMLSLKGDSPLMRAILADNADIRETLSRVGTNRQPSEYEAGEYGFLFRTRYGIVASTQKSNVVTGEDTIGVIKSTKLSTSFFDRHLRGTLPTYRGFTTTYEAITGVAAPDAVRQMDAALNQPSIGHAFNRVLGVKVYSDGKGVLGSIATIVGKALDFGTGHYGFRDDLARRKGLRGSPKKFVTTIDKTWLSEQKYQGGPLEQTLDAFYETSRGLLLAATGSAAVFALQHITAGYLEEGLHHTLEPSRQNTLLQQQVARQYLSPLGRKVLATSQELLSQQPTLSLTAARTKAMALHGVTDRDDLLGKGTALPNLLNKMRAASAGYMAYALPSILEMVVPKQHLPEALEASKKLVSVIGAPLTLNAEGLQNLQLERTRNIGVALEEVSRYIPLKLHHWLPPVRQLLGIENPTSLNSSPSEVRLGSLDSAHPSLSAALGRGLIGGAIDSFVSTAQHASRLLINPEAQLERLASLYKDSAALRKADTRLLSRLSAGTATEQALEYFFQQTDRASNRLASFAYAQPAIARSLAPSVKGGLTLGRAAFAATSLVVGDFLLDEFFLKNQGADLFTQLALTRTTRNSNGNIVQVELNATAPGAVAAGIASIGGISAGYLFPTVYTASKHSNRTLQAIAEYSAEHADRVSTRIRFNTKAALVGAAASLVALRLSFGIASALGNAFFPSQGPRLDPEAEVVSSKLMSVLNRTRHILFDRSEDGSNYIKQSATTNRVILRQTLNSVVDFTNSSDLKANNIGKNSTQYTIAAQPANMGFLQVAIVQRTDALAQKTSYSFGVQLFATAGMGVTPTLPVGIFTKLPNSSKARALATLRYRAQNERLGTDGNNIVSNVADAALNVFGFLSYEPNSQVTNSLLGLGSLVGIQQGVNYLDRKLTKYGTQELNKTEGHLELDAVRKVGRLALQLTASSLKYATALSDFLPRMLANGVATAMPAFVSSSPGLSWVKSRLKPLHKNRYGLLGFALGTAMTDPFMGVEALDESDANVKDHPFIEPTARLTTAATMSVLVAASANDLGLTGKISQSSVLTKLIPQANLNQSILADPNSTNLRKSGARVGLIAGAVFGLYALGTTIARTIGQFGGESALSSTYQTFGILRLLSGVRADEYRDGRAYSQRNLLGDLASDILSKVPIIGESLADLTGAYRSAPNLYLPAFGTPFGFSYGADGAARVYAQAQSGTSDLSISAYNKVQFGYTAAMQQIFANIERADLSKAQNPDAVAYALLIGGTARTKGASVSQVSKYAAAEIEGDLARAFNLRAFLSANAAMQRPVELQIKDMRAQYLAGLASIWTGTTKDLLPPSLVDINYGIQMQFRRFLGTTVSELTTADNYGLTLTNAAYLNRNVKQTSITQALSDMYSAYSPSSKKDKPNFWGSAILSIIGTASTVVLAGTSIINATEALGAVEVLKHGKSVSRLETLRLQEAKAFQQLAGFKFKAGSNELGAPIIEITSDRDSSLYRSVDLEGKNYSIGQVRQAYYKGIEKLRLHFAANPAGASYSGWAGGRMQNALDLVLGGDARGGDILHRNYIKTLAHSRTGVLSSSIGDSTFFNLFISDKHDSINPIEFVNKVTSRALYEPLEAYAAELAQRPGLSRAQKLELLAAYKNQIERAHLESRVLGLSSNSLPPSVSKAVTSFEGTPGLGKLFSRAVGGAGILLSGYLVFGRTAYSLAEGTSFVLGSDRRMARYGAEGIYDTTVNTAVALGAQRLISRTFGVNEFGLAATGLTIAASLLVSYGAEQLKNSSLGRSVVKAERATKDFVSTGVLLAGGLLSMLPPVSWLADLTGNNIFKPLGLKIQSVYNKSSRSSLAEAMLAQLFLPDTVFKVNDFIPRSARYGNVTIYSPFVTNADLKLYYQNLRSAEVKKTYSVQLRPTGVSEYLLGQHYRADYAQNIFYSRWFASRQAPSPFENFSIGSTYTTSITQQRALAMRAQLSAYYQYGNDLRRPAWPDHQYLPQWLSGAGTFNEAQRISTHGALSLSRLFADAYGGVDRYAIDPLQKITRGLGRASLNTFGQLNRRWLGPTANWLSEGFERIGSFNAQWMGGVRGFTQSFTQAASQNSTQTAANVLGSAQIDFEERLVRWSSYISAEQAGPIASFTLKALSGLSNIAAKATVYGFNVLGKLPEAKAIGSVPTLNRPPNVGFNSPLPLVQGQYAQAVGRNLTKVIKFSAAMAPTFFDAAQVMPATFKLIGATETQLTRMERQRRYEEQGSAVGALIGGLAASAFRSNLITTIATSLISSFVLGKLARSAASADYDRGNEFWRDTQIGVGLISVTASAAQSLYAYYRRVSTYNNYVEINTDPDGNKRVETHYDKKFLNRRDYLQNQHKRLSSQLSSRYNNTSLDRITRELIQLDYEYEHEQAHLQQYDPYNGGNFTPRIGPNLNVGNRIESRLRRLAELSAQERIYQNPHLDEAAYNRIVELEYQANHQGYTNIRSNIEAGHYGNVNSANYLEHYLDGIERQTTRGRGFIREAQALAHGSETAVVERLYTPVARNQVNGVNNKVSSVHFEKASSLLATGFKSTTRMVTAAATALNLPTALLQTYSNQTDLSLIGAGYQSLSSNRQTRLALSERAKDKVKFAYVGLIAAIGTSLYKSSFATLTISLYSGFASFGGNLPFTSLPLAPTVGLKQISNVYADYQLRRLRAGEAAYEPWEISTAPLLALQQHDTDRARQYLTGKILRKGSRTSFTAARSLGRKVLNATNPRTRFIGLGLVATGLLVSDVEILKLHKGTDAYPFVIGILALSGISALAIKKTKPLAKHLIKSSTTFLASSQGGIAVNHLIRTAQYATKNYTRQYTKLYNFIEAYKAYNKVTEVGKITGLATKYANFAGMPASLNTYRALRLLSAPQRLVTQLRRFTSRPLEMLWGNATRAIEDYGIQKLSGYKPSSTSSFGNWIARVITNGAAKFDSIVYAGFYSPATNLNTSASTTVAQGPATKLVTKLGTGAGVTWNWLSRIAPTGFKLLGIGLVGMTAYNQHGGLGLGVSAAVAGGSYLAYKRLSKLTVGKALANSIVQHGVVGSALRGAELAIDTTTVFKTVVSLSLVERQKVNRAFLQTQYTQAASATTGLITGTTLIPRFGTIGGILSGIALNVFQTEQAEAKANQRYEQMHSTAYTPTSVYAVLDILKPTLQQTLFASALGDVYDQAWKSKRGLALSTKLAKLPGVKTWNSIVDDTIRSSSKAIQKRISSAFGAQTMSQINKIYYGLQNAGEVIKIGASSLIKNVVKFIDIGTAAYGTYKIFTAKNDIERKEGYKMAGSAIGSMIGFALPALLGTVLEAVPGAGTAAHAALSIGGGIAGGYIGEGIGAWFGDLHAAINRGSTKLASGVGNFFNFIGEYIFGAKASAAQAPGSLSVEKAEPTKTTMLAFRNRGLPWYRVLLEKGLRSTLSFERGTLAGWDSATNTMRKEGRAAKLAWGRFTTQMTNRFIVGFHKPKPNAPATSAEPLNGVDNISGNYVGQTPVEAELVKKAQQFSRGGSVLISALKEGSVYSGRAETTISFGKGAISEVQGKTIKIGADLRAISDIVAIGETSYPNSMKGYAVTPTTGNKNSGRYQIMYGMADTNELGSKDIVKGGITDWTPDSQDKTFVGRMFYRGLNSGGKEFLDFVKGGYKYADFAKLLDKLSNQNEVLRSSRNSYSSGSVSGRTYLDRKYGNAEAAYKYYYDYFLSRRAKYGGNPQVATPESGPMNPYSGRNSGTSIVISAGHLAEHQDGEPGAPGNVARTNLTYIDSKGNKVTNRGVVTEGTANLVVFERLVAYGKRNNINIINGLPSGPIGLGTHLKNIRALADKNNAEIFEIHHDDRDSGRPGVIASKAQDALGKGLAQEFGYYGGSPLYGAPKSQGGQSRFSSGLGSFRAGVNLLEISKLTVKDTYGKLVTNYHLSLLTNNKALQQQTRSALDSYVDQNILPRIIRGFNNAGIGVTKTSTPPKPAITPTISPARANQIVNYRATASSTKPSSLKNTPTTKQLQVESTNIRRTSPQPAGRSQQKHPRQLKISLDANNNLVASAEATDVTQFSLANTPPSARYVNGRRLNIA